MANLLNPWEKPWINDFRGTNSSRITTTDRGLVSTTARPVVRPSATRTPHIPAYAEISHDPDTLRNKATIARVSGKSTLALAIAEQETNTLTSKYLFGDTYPIDKEYFQLQKRALNARGTDWAPISLFGAGGGFGFKAYGASLFTPHDSVFKQGDAANFGVYKMNWLMIKQTPTGMRMIGRERYKQLLAGRPIDEAEIERAVGTEINDNTGTATMILKDATKLWSLDEPDPKNPKAGNFWAGHRAGASGLYNKPGVDWNGIHSYYEAVHAIKRASDNAPNIWTDPLRWWVNTPNI